MNSQQDLHESVKDLTEAVNKLDSRINRLWKMFLYGVLQGAGAVVGAVLIASVVGLIFGIFDFIPFVGGFGESLSQSLENTR